MTMKRIRTVAIAAFAALTFATTAQAQIADNITASDENTILQAMQDFGLVATMGKDGQGDPKISSRVSSSKFEVYFYGCTENTQCKSLLFRAGYDLKQGISAEKVNEWNQQKRFTKAYINDDGDPRIEMDVNLDFDGVGAKNFEDTLDWWRLLIEGFEEFIDW